MGRLFICAAVFSVMVSSPAWADIQTRVIQTLDTLTQTEILPDPNSIIVKQGAEFVVQLPIQPNSTAQWQLAQPLDEALVGQGAIIRRAKVTDPKLIGQTWAEEWRFSADASGQTMLAFAYVEKNAGSRAPIMQKFIPVVIQK